MPQRKTLALTSQGSCPRALSISTRNVPNPFQPNPNQLIPYNGRLGTATMSLRDTLIPYPFFPANPLGATVGFNRYNAMILQLQRTFSGGLLFNAHYTWSKAMEVYHAEAQNNQFAENAGYRIAGTLAAEIPQYMLAVRKALLMKPTPGLEQLAAGEKLNPDLLKQWFVFLTEAEVQHHYNQPWNALMAKGGGTEQGKPGEDAAAPAKSYDPPLKFEDPASQHIAGGVEAL